MRWLRSVGDQFQPAERASGTLARDDDSALESRRIVAIEKMEQGTLSADRKFKAPFLRLVRDIMSSRGEMGSGLGPVSGNGEPCRSRLSGLNLLPRSLESEYLAA